MTTLHQFHDESLRQAALLHPSLRGRAANGRAAGKNMPKAGAASPFERLEFVGDRVLGLIMASWLYELAPQQGEGELAKRHAHLVRREACAQVARAMGLPALLQVAASEKKTNEAGESQLGETVLGDALEAYLGAVYLDGGLAAVSQLVRHYWQPLLADNFGEVADPKSALQELAQARGWPLPHYELVSQTGPAHAPLFVVAVQVASGARAEASGTNKQQAEKAAALVLLQQLRQIQKETGK